MPAIAALCIASHGKNATLLDTTVRVERQVDGNIAAAGKQRRHSTG